ncbi:VWFA domain-containing protein [Mycena kentingensis (nom. inval.)]|nr:VWFA domain-containing protein [Mycena kentingensis (nom. inval.)]
MVSSKKTKTGQESILHFFARKQPSSSSLSSSKPHTTITSAPRDASTSQSISTRPPSRAGASVQPKRKATVDSDSDVEPSSAVVYLSRSSPCHRNSLPSPAISQASDKENVNYAPHTTPPRKKLRSESPCPLPDATGASNELPIPSSQSDEEELVASPSQNPVPEATSDEMDVDQPFERASTPEPAPVPHNVLLQTPRRDTLAPPPVTPVALTPRSKTAAIIAAAKARAKAEAESSSDEEAKPRVLRDLVEDSDDDLEDLPPIAPKVTFAPPPAPTRYGLRGRAPPTTAKPAAAKPVAKRLPPPVKPKQADPLGALLKEKRDKDKKGTGGKALRQAESTARAGSPLSDLTDDEQDVDYSNEERARAAVQALTTSSPGQNSDDEGVSVDDNDQVRLLGAKQGQEVAQLLKSERTRLAVAKSQERVTGVPLWHQNAPSMQVESAIPLWPLDISESPVVSGLRASLESGSTARAAMILNSGIFGRSRLPFPVVSCLCVHAFSDHELTLPAFNALSHMWHNVDCSTPAVPFDVVLSTLVRVGAREDILEQMGWQIPVSCQRNAVSPVECSGILYRLVQLVGLSAKSSAPVSSDINDVIVALLVIGMDPTIGPDLRREIASAVDGLCLALDPGEQVCDMERALCGKLFKLASPLEWHNRSHLLAMIASGCGRSQRLARVLGHVLVVGISEFSQDQYCDLPPLAAILAVLSPSDEEQSIFELKQDTNYVELVFKVHILSIALSNIDGYVKEEASQRQRNPQSPSKSAGDKPETMVSRIIFALDDMHGNIVDTRAAHLDRSRAKGVLKQLSMRVHYQHEHASKSVRGTKLSRPIQQYFAKNK